MDGSPIAWGYVQVRIVHLASTPFARRSAIFNGQVVSHTLHMQH